MGKVKEHYSERMEYQDGEEDFTCPHENQYYQPKENDTNVPESLTCEDCGADLEIPEPDWDLMAKEI